MRAATRARRRFSSACLPQGKRPLGSVFVEKIEGLHDLFKPDFRIDRLFEIETVCFRLLFDGDARDPHLFWRLIFWSFARLAILLHFSEQSAHCVVVRVDWHSQDAARVFDGNERHIDAVLRHKSIRKGA